MVECMASFSEPTRRWFSRVFGAPTEAQTLAWPAIAAGGDVLVIAPTGSGKTLAAFLAAIDRVIAGMASDAVANIGDDAAAAKQAVKTTQPEKTAQPTKSKQSGRKKGFRKAKRGVRILYISPLKALGVDVAKNLEAPLDGIRHEYKAMGLAVPQVSIATRSGDTTAQERRAIVAHPPDILVTTPESLYLMLTSKARGILETVDTVILDEVHALAGTKRGAHLALSLERLDARLPRPAQRIGLSATVNPVEQAARFLAGARDVTIAQAQSCPRLDIRIVDAGAALGATRTMGGNAGSKDSVDGTTASAMRTTSTHITGVTPAMERAARRRGQSDALTPRADGAAPAGGGEPNASVWPYIESSVLDEVLAHRTTLVFVNSRGLAERLTARLNDLYASRRGATRDEGREPAHYNSLIGSTTKLVGAVDPDDVVAMAHHGSVSKDRRKQIETQLKQGRLRCVVATSSLELGIDMGSVDLVIQIAPPLSISSGLQRVGRADHHVGGISHAIMYPCTRQQIVAAAASAEHMLAGAIEPLHVPQCPLDVLAQQTVAAASLEPLDADEWFATVRRAAPYMHLERDVYDAVVGMVSGAYDGEEFSAFRPALVYDAATHTLAARPGAQRLAVTSGGTIPDRGMYTVVLPEAEAGRGPRRVGELDEEMVYESRVGDIITLGTTSWRIEQITNDRVVVVPAPGRSARLPFWHGEGDGRDYGFALAIGRWVGEVGAGLIAAARADVDVVAAADGDAEDGAGKDSAGKDSAAQGDVAAQPAVAKPRFTPEVRARLVDDGLDDAAIDAAAAFLAAQKAATGVIPDATHIVIERCRDEEGDWRVLVHAPFGRRVHEPWALAINARLLQRYGVDGQIYAADDGLVIRLPDGDGSIDIASLIAFDADDVTRLVETQVTGSVLFAARFRECAARALFMPRADPSKRVPLWQQRLRAAQLLTAARTHRNFPLLLETARECLQDVYDVPALREVLDGLADGRIGVYESVTTTPSPMAEQLLFGFIGSVMYQYDVPQAERNARLLSMDPQVLERLLGSDDLASVLDDAVIDDVADALARRTFWNTLADDDVRGRVHRYLSTHGPFTADMMIADLRLPAEACIDELNALQASGEALAGRFDDRLPADVPQWVARDVLKRIRSRSLAKARKSIKPVAVADFQRFVLERQGVGSAGGQRFDGVDGVMRVIEQLEGAALPIDVWECAVFPARVRDYTPTMLDELVAAGEVVWVGASSASASASASASSSSSSDGLAAVMLFPFDSTQLQERCAPVDAQTQAQTKTQTNDDGRADDDGSTDDASAPLGVGDAIVAALADGGAYGPQPLEERARACWERAGAEPCIDETTGEVVGTAWSHTRFEDALWSLARRGRITNSSFAVARASETRGAPARPTRRRRMRAHMPRPTMNGGLWSLVRAVGEPCTPEERVIDLIDVLLDRYGVITQPVVDHEGVPGGFSGLYPVLRRMEEQGVLMRGVFVDGFGAAQFARRETVDTMRGLIGNAPATVALDASDPAVLYGTAIRWPEPMRMAAVQNADSADDADDAACTGGAKPMRRAGSIVVLRGGDALLYAAPKSGRLVMFDEPISLAERACTALADMLRRLPGGSVTFRDCNGVPLTARLAVTPALRAAGFAPSPQGMKLYR